VSHFPRELDRSRRSVYRIETYVGHLAAAPGTRDGLVPPFLI
jgi:hypothetical protein